MLRRTLLWTQYCLYESVVEKEEGGEYMDFFEWRRNAAAIFG